MYIHTFEVMGRGHFPFDMLRYDHCFPRDTTSAQNMEVQPDVRHREDRTIRLIAHSSSKTWEPTIERWNSFGWGVFKVEEARKA